MSSPIESPNDDAIGAGSEPEARLADKTHDTMKPPFLSASISNGENSPNELRQILQYYYILDQKKHQVTPKSEETTINIRIPPRPPKKVEIKYIEEDEEGPVDSIRIPISNKLRMSLNKNRMNHRSNSKLFMPKRVFTPDWESAEASKNSHDSFTRSEDSDSESEGAYKNLDDVELHRRLEVLENRIIYGNFKHMIHPAQAMKLLQSDMNLIFTKAEAERAERYEQQDEPQTIPQFWEPRRYDKPENRLTTEQSNELSIKIIQSTIRPEKPKSSSKSDKKPLKRSMSVSMHNTKKGRPKTLEVDPNVLTLPIGTFETDDESVLSEWEDFI